MKPRKRTEKPQTGSSHGRVAEDRVRTSFIGDKENHEFLAKAAASLKVTQGTLIREAVQRLVDEIIEKKGVIQFKTRIEDLPTPWDQKTFKRKK